MAKIEEIDWSPRAKDNLKKIAEYISNDSQKNANAFLEQIFDHAENLKSFPLMGKIVSELKDPNIRELLFKNNYRIIYRVLEKKIQIITVRHAKRLFRL
ncbi:MAG: type II toxin-antitoxin system RelE/ParE family toxin [Promethearchaeota archaeon]